MDNSFGLYSSQPLKSIVLISKYPCTHSQSNSIVRLPTIREEKNKNHNLSYQDNQYSANSYLQGAVRFVRNNLQSENIYQAVQQKHQQHRYQKYTMTNTGVPNNIQYIPTQQDSLNPNRNQNYNTSSATYAIAPLDNREQLSAQQQQSRNYSSHSPLQVNKAYDNQRSVSTANQEYSLQEQSSSVTPYYPYHKDLLSTLSDKHDNYAIKLPSGVTHQYPNPDYPLTTYNTQNPVVKYSYAPNADPYLNQNSQLNANSIQNYQDNAYSQQQAFNLMMDQPHYNNMSVPGTINYAYRSAAVDSPEASPTPVQDGIFKVPASPLSQRKQPPHQIKQDVYKLDSPLNQLYIQDMSLDSPLSRSDNFEVENIPSIPPRIPLVQASNTQSNYQTSRVSPQLSPQPVYYSNQPAQLSAQSHPIQQRLRSGTVEMSDVTANKQESLENVQQRGRAGTVEMIDSSSFSNNSNKVEQRVRSGTVDMVDGTNVQTYYSPTNIQQGAHHFYNPPEQPLQPISPQEQQQQQQSQLASQQQKPQQSYSQQFSQPLQSLQQHQQPLQSLQQHQQPLQSLQQHQQPLQSLQQHQQPLQSLQQHQQPLQSLQQHQQPLQSLQQHQQPLQSLQQYQQPLKSLQQYQQQQYLQQQQQQSMLQQTCQQPQQQVSKDFQQPLAYKPNEAVSDYYSSNQQSEVNIQPMPNHLCAGRETFELKDTFNGTPPVQRLHYMQNNNKAITSYHYNEQIEKQLPLHDNVSEKNVQQVNVKHGSGIGQITNQQIDVLKQQAVSKTNVATTSTGDVKRKDISNQISLVASTSTDAENVLTNNSLSKELEDQKKLMQQQYIQRVQQAHLQQQLRQIQEDYEANLQLERDIAQEFLHEQSRQNYCISSEQLYPVNSSTSQQGLPFLSHDSQKSHMIPPFSVSKIPLNSVVSPQQEQLTHSQQKFGSHQQHLSQQQLHLPQQQQHLPQQQQHLSQHQHLSQQQQDLPQQQHLPQQQQHLPPQQQHIMQQQQHLPQQQHLSQQQQSVPQQQHLSQQQQHLSQQQQQNISQQQHLPPQQHPLPKQQHSHQNKQPIVIMPGGGPMSNPGQYVTSLSNTGRNFAQQTSGQYVMPTKVQDLSPTTVEGKQPTPFQKLRKIAEDISSFVDDIVKFKGAKDGNEYKYLEEMLTRQLLLLDKVAANTSDELRNARKSLVKEVQELLEILDRRATKTSKK